MWCVFDQQPQTQELVNSPMFWAPQIIESVDGCSNLGGGGGGVADENS